MKDESQVRFRAFPVMAWVVLAAVVCLLLVAPSGVVESFASRGSSVAQAQFGQSICQGLLDRADVPLHAAQKMCEKAQAKAKKKAKRAAEKAAIVEKALAQAREIGSATEYFIAVDIAAKRTIVFKRVDDDWKLEKYWVCSTGAPDMPTVLGVYEVGGRGYSFGDEEGYTCYYYTQFFGNYLFHSIKYNPGTFDVQDGRLGEAVSEGCVRLKLENAKWIYDVIPWSTRVITYE